MDKPLLIFQKNADIEKNRVIIPKAFIEKNGRNFSMEVYEDKIILKPIKKGKQIMYFNIVVINCGLYSIKRIASDKQIKQHIT